MWDTSAQPVFWRLDLQVYEESGSPHLQGRVDENLPVLSLHPQGPREQIVTLHGNSRGWWLEAALEVPTDPAGIGWTDRVACTRLPLLLESFPSLEAPLKLF